jgi:dihydroceramidase
MPYFTILELIFFPDPMQLIDELSMIYTTCLMFWATFAYSRPQPVQLLLGICSASLALFITGYYHYLQDPTFHQIAYAILTVIVFFRSLYVMELNIRPYYGKRHEDYVRAQQSPTLSKAEKAEESRRDERDKEILKTMWTMIAVGLSLFLGGFAIWNLDNIYCSKLRAWRHEIGLPWGIVLEGHGWWHLMTGIGAYFYIQWGIWLRHCLNGGQDEFEMVWPSILTSFPRVERMRPESNGVLKKAN